MVPIGIPFRPILVRTCVRIMSHDIATYYAVMALLRTGLSDYKIAAQTGVNQSTVRNWRRAAGPPQTIERAELAATWSVEDGPSYCYLLGAYLGDGTVQVGKGMSLRIVNDRGYPGVSSEILEAMARIFPGRSPASTRRRPASRTFSASAIRRSSAHSLSTELDGSTFAPSSWRTGSSSSPMLIPNHWFAGSSIQTVAESSTGSERNSRAAASPSTPTCATSSATCLPTSDGSSATTASCWASA